MHIKKPKIYTMLKFYLGFHHYGIRSSWFVTQSGDRCL